MNKVSINITIEDGIIIISDNFNNTTTNDFDPDVTISDQIGTYVADHIESTGLYSEIISEGIDNADYNDDEEFDELDD